MNKIYALIIFILIQLIGTTQMNAQYLIGKRTLNFYDVSRNNREVNAEISYPAIAAGQNTMPANGQFPLIVIGHGFVMTIDAYTNFVNTLVPLGYVVVLCNTETSFSPSHDNFARDLLFLNNDIKHKSQNDGSFFLYQHLSGTSAIMGHSMGGGSSVLAASLANTGNLNCIVGFAPAETNPSAVTAAGLVNIPALIFAGQGDNVTPPAAHQIPIYNALTTSCAILVTIKGGGHCYFAQPNAACDFGETFSNSNISITREEQQDVMFDFLLPFLDLNLRFNTAAKQILNDSLTQSTRITYQNKNCESLSLSPYSIGKLSIRILDNTQVKEQLRFVANFNKKGTVLVTVQSHDGKVVSEQRIAVQKGEQEYSISLPPLAKGMYLAGFYFENIADSAKFMVTTP
ncbi:MAG: alpha/beta hydrolase [Flavobacteriales bacterium]|nr:alpha/beta hydrolase [Flavobacteriales bacterium]